MRDEDILTACIAACDRCAAACDHCSVACLQEDNVAHMAKCIQLDMDCAASCRFTAGALARKSEFSSTIARMCAEICRACGQECGQHDHKHCQECARACEECAHICEELAA
ncbi:four-helix bundle copper-binding protein [Marinobacter changyiensis]|uniref:four-helix bundle copper-binding protein n=1 Tax=Marinobacter changyiensis TaxID=2604091 RepID=UPI0012641A78|nr:four-helix bundle copper-binding protein [Marinobacter changyiensis]